MSLRVWGQVLAALYATLIYGFIFLPVVVLVLFSLQSGRLPVPPFNGPSLRWYEAVLADRDVVAALGNSVILGIGSSALATLLGFLAAYGLARHTPRGAGVIRALLILPLTVSTLIIGLGLLIFFNALGLSKSLWLVGIGHVVINLPLCFAILYSQMGQHQAVVERAARDLGATEIDVLWLITAPMLIVPLIASFALSLTFSWDEFVIAYLLTQFDATLPVEINSLLRGGLNPRTNAVGSLVFLISVAIVLVMELLVFGRRRPVAEAPR